jgi:hypothetical protein
VKVFIQFFVRKKEGIRSLVAVVLFGIFSLSYAYAVFERAHLLQSVAIAYILFGYVMYTIFQKKGIKSKVTVIVLVLVLGLYIVDSFKWRNHFYSGSISRLYAIKKEGAKEVSSPKGKVYVGKTQFDMVQNLISFFKGKTGYLLPLFFHPLANFLTGLENPTRFSYLYPTLIEDRLKQNQVIGEMEKYKIEYLLIPRVMWTSEGNVRLGDYAPVLYEYVKKQYPFKREVDGFLVFCRQPL